MKAGFLIGICCILAAAGALSAETHPVPTVRLDFVVAFEPLETGTRLREYLRISAPRPVLGIVVDRTVATHTEFLAGVRRHFERRSRRASSDAGRD